MNFSPVMFWPKVETDKATMELENYHEGYLLHIGVKSGPVPVNGILAVIGEKGEDYKEQLEEEQKKDGPSKSTKESELKSETDAIGNQLQNKPL